MGLPMTKIITLVWDGVDWRDQETGILVTGVTKPYGDITAAISPTESMNDAIGAVEDIAELIGWPCIDSDRSEDNFVMTFKRGKQ